MFTHFGLHKKPAITYKRKARPSSSSDLDNVLPTPSNPVLPINEPTIEPKPNDDLDIFDFPEDDDDTLAVELMVATERTRAAEESQPVQSKPRPRKPKPKPKPSSAKRAQPTFSCPKPNGVKPIGPKPIGVRPKPIATLSETYTLPKNNQPTRSLQFQTIHPSQTAVPMPPTVTYMPCARPTQLYDSMAPYNNHQHHQHQHQHNINNTNTNHHTLRLTTSHDMSFGIQPNYIPPYTSAPMHLPIPIASTSTPLFNNENQLHLQTWPMPFLDTSFAPQLDFSSINPTQLQQPYIQHRQPRPRHQNQPQIQPQHNIQPTYPVQSPPRFTAPPTHSNRPKKQKMNLVSRLKSASGNSVGPETKPAHHFEFSDDEENEEIYFSKPSKPIVEPPPPKPEPKQLPRKEHMEKELEFLMKAEFGTDTAPAKAINRPRYMPENPMKVCVTYKRSNGEARKQNEKEELERFEKLLLELREE